MAGRVRGTVTSWTMGYGFIETDEVPPVVAFAHPNSWRQTRAWALRQGDLVEYTPTHNPKNAQQDLATDIRVLRRDGVDLDINTFVVQNNLKGQCQVDLEDLNVECLFQVIAEGPVHTRANNPSAVISSRIKTAQILSDVQGSEPNPRRAEPWVCECCTHPNAAENQRCGGDDAGQGCGRRRQARPPPPPRPPPPDPVRGPEDARATKLPPSKRPRDDSDQISAHRGADAFVKKYGLDVDVQTQVHRLIEQLGGNYMMQRVTSMDAELTRRGDQIRNRSAFVCKGFKSAIEGKGQGKGKDGKASQLLLKGGKGNPGESNGKGHLAVPPIRVRARIHEQDIGGGDPDEEWIPPPDEPPHAAADDGDGAYVPRSTTSVLDDEVPAGAGSSPARVEDRPPSYADRAVQPAECRAHQSTDVNMWHDEHDFLCPQCIIDLASGNLGNPSQMAGMKALHKEIAKAEQDIDDAVKDLPDPGVGAGERHQDALVDEALGPLRANAKSMKDRFEAQVVELRRKIDRRLREQEELHCAELRSRWAPPIDHAMVMGLRGRAAAARGPDALRQRKEGLIDDLRNAASSGPTAPPTLHVAEAAEDFDLVSCLSDGHIGRWRVSGGRTADEED